MTLKNNRAPLLSNIKLYASFHHHMRIQTGVTVRKRLSWVVTSVTLTFDLWPWPFAWTLLWSLVITPENFMMIRWGEHSQKGVTDGQTDRQTDGQMDRGTENTICRAAWSQLEMCIHENAPENVVWGMAAMLSRVSLLNQDHKEPGHQLPQYCPRLSEIVCVERQHCKINSCKSYNVIITWFRGDSDGLVQDCSFCSISL